MDINSGWNWLGYTPHVSQGVNHALSGLPAPLPGDLIKSRDEFAFYIDDAGWFGSLNFLHPGQSFMLMTESTGSFSYPGWSARQVRGEQGEIPVCLLDAPDWSVRPEDYEYTASLTAEVWWDGMPADSNHMVGAFVDGECRGLATPILVLDRYLVFLTIYANTNNELVQFELYYESMDEIWAADETLVFTRNEVFGTPLDPILLHPTLAPEAPQSLGIPYTESEITLHWEDIAGATFYSIYAADDINGNHMDVTNEGVFGSLGNAERAIVTWTVPIAADLQRLYQVTSQSAVTRERSAVYPSVIRGSTASER